MIEDTKQPEDIGSLYRRAFAKYGTQALWNKRYRGSPVARFAASRMPTDKTGLLFLEDGVVVQPDPDRLASYQTHAGQRRGQWPSSLDIIAAMLERYNTKQEGNKPHT